MSKQRRSPQDKKMLSYERDTRFVYGESGSSSRKSVRLRKRWVNTTYRSGVKRALRHSETADGDEAAAAERVQRKNWRKVPDEPLGRIAQLGYRSGGPL